MASITNLKDPVFYHREYTNDIDTIENDTYDLQTAKRIALISLPFFGCIRVFRFPISLTLGGLRFATSFSQLLAKLQKGETKEISYAFFQTGFAVTSLGGILFAHPLGMFVTTVHDCALDCIHIGHDLYSGELLSALGNYVYLMNNSLYLALLVQGGVQVAVASLGMQVFLGFSQSFSEYRKGKYLESGGHFFMGIIRGRQLHSQVKLLQKSWLEKHVYEEENMKIPKRYRPSTKGNIFHTAAYYLQKPVQKTTEFLLRAVCTPIRPGIEGNWKSPTLERVNRLATICLSVAFAPITVPLYTLGEGMHFCGNAINGTAHTYWRGNGVEKIDDRKMRCMTLNTCMLWGGLPIPLGGLRPPGERMDQLAELIKEQNPDILFLQESSFAPSYELFDKLKDQYVHCYTRIGPNFVRMESGLTVLSNVPIQSVQFLPFPGQNGIKRGAFCVETPSKYFVATHLESGESEEDMTMRREQLDLIINQIKDIKKEKALDAFILGDLNIDSFDSLTEYNESIGSHPDLHDPRSNHTIGTESCTNKLDQYMLGKAECEKPSEMDDYALVYGDADTMNLETKLVDTYSVDEPYAAISDHKALVLDIRS